MAGVFCNGQSFCNPTLGTCDSWETAYTCNDGNVCNGLEICNEVADTCLPSEPSCEEVVLIFPPSPVEHLSGGFFFDTRASVRDIQIEQVDLYAKGSGIIKILIRAGTAKGYTSSNEMWSEVAQLPLSNLAPFTNIAIPISVPFKMYSGTSFGMFIYADGDASIAYSAGERAFTS